MVKSLYLRSRKYRGWRFELECRGKLEICKLQIWSSPFSPIFSCITAISLIDLTAKWAYSCDQSEKEENNNIIDKNIQIFFNVTLFFDDLMNCDFEERRLKVFSNGKCLFWS
jgi:hypothetical protein